MGERDEQPYEGAPAVAREQSDLTYPFFPAYLCHRTGDLDPHLRTPCNGDRTASATASPGHTVSTTTDGSATAPPHTFGFCDLRIQFLTT